jgi:putative FmdB family regulatory protein
MPIFEYKCESCGCEFEKLVKNSEQQVQCEKCLSENVNKKLSSFAAKISGAGTPSSCSVSDCSSCCPSGTCSGM